MSVQPLYITHFISCLILVSLHDLLFTSLYISKYLSKMMLLSRKTVSAFLSFLVLSVTSTNGSEISANEDKAFPLANAKRSNIVGGTAVPAGKYRWFAQGLQSNGYWQKCGGSLVTPEYVLTSALCVGPNSPTLSKYKIGALSIDGSVQNSV